MSKAAAQPFVEVARGCQSIVWRASAVQGQLMEQAAHRQFCGRPIQAEGLCAYHLRRSQEPSDERSWRRALKVIRRG